MNLLRLQKLILLPEASAQVDGWPGDGRSGKDFFELDKPEPLFEVAVRDLAGRWYDVAPNGRFLMRQISIWW